MNGEFSLVVTCVLLSLWLLSLLAADFRPCFGDFKVGSPLPFPMLLEAMCADSFASCDSESVVMIDDIRVSRMAFTVS